MSEDSSAGSGANPSELGDGLKLDSGIAERLFQFQLTGTYPASVGGTGMNPVAVFQDSCERELSMSSGTFCF